MDVVVATSARWNMAGLINFEDENEVKQFLDNLGVEYSFQCYKEKDPEGKFMRCSQISDPETLDSATGWNWVIRKC